MLIQKFQGVRMRNFLVIILCIIVGYWLSKLFVDIYDRICYVLLGICIKHGDEKVQKEISKILCR